MRRDFMKTGLMAGGFLGLQRALGAGVEVEGRFCEGYGPLVKDPKGILDLPEGFSYRVISRQGEKMSDGFVVPGRADGMAAFAGKDGRVILVRNHELGVATASLGAIPNAKEYPEEVPCYDAGAEGELVMPGGTTHLIYNPATGEVEKEFLSLVGTDRNCAGGPTPWGTWIPCEEPEYLQEGRGVKHGWCFEVEVEAKGMQQPVAMKGLGRFRHEAIAVDPKTKIIFLTEDRHEGLFYRFVPGVEGGEGCLQALALEGVPDSRNWLGPQLAEGKKVSARWIDLEDTASPRDDLRFRGAEDGATIFARGEGCWWFEDEVWFCCTNGGSEKRGQLFRLKPEGEGGGRLELFLEPRKSDLLTNGDNLTVAKNKDVIIAEDRVPEIAESQICSLRGVTAEGRIYTLATNRLNTSELAGVCFSPDDQILFLNIQNPGLTIAVTGDWASRKP